MVVYYLLGFILLISDIYCSEYCIQRRNKELTQSWYKYIERLIRDMLVNRDVQYKNVRGIVQTNKAILSLLTNFECYYNRPEQVFTEVTEHHTQPVTTLTLLSGHDVHKTWKITVHKDFMINITIFKAYVPLTDGCSNFIRIREPRNKWRFFTKQRFCGHVAMETVYTEGNTGLLEIQSLSLPLPYPVHISARYEVQDKGLAYVYRYRWLHFAHCLTYNWTVNFQLTYVIHMYGDMFYYWYINNTIFHPLQTKLSKYIPTTALSLTRITIQTCLSAINNSISTKSRFVV